uniref:Uncharacterized protein n=1 Tax=Oryza nivara TaxID=4536 RepID=A0A0E0HRD6_ORYNI
MGAASRSTCAVIGILRPTSSVGCAAAPPAPPPDRRDKLIEQLQSRRLPPHLRSALSPSTTTTVAHRIASPLSPAAANRSQLDATRHLISRWSRMEVRNFNEKLVE